MQKYCHVLLSLCFRSNSTCKRSTWQVTEDLKKWRQMTSIYTVVTPTPPLPKTVENAIRPDVIAVRGHYTTVEYVTRL